MLLQTQKSSLWAAAGFYALIALEFLYMATPFAAFFYSVYSPVINFTNRFEWLSWLNGTFLPHIVHETRSSLLNAVPEVGIALFIIGMSGFIVGAVQVYYSKLFRRQIVSGGIYRYIRHPQYASLIVWGMGMTLLWPRTIVLISFVSMLFIYYRLAVTEERECEKKFGESYVEYKKKTSMFFPMTHHIKIFSLPAFGVKRIFSVAALYLVSMLAAFGVSMFLREWSVQSLYARYEKNAAFISVTQMSQDDIQQIISIALSEPDIKQRLKNQTGSTGKYYLNYILPKEMYMLEVSMNRDEATESHHFMLSSHADSMYKIIFTNAEVRSGSIYDGEELLFRTTARIPLLEVYIDYANGKVVEIKDPPMHVALSGVSLPLF